MFVLYYKLNCPYSEKANTLMKEYKLSYIKVITNDNYLLLSEIKQAFNYNKMPVIIYYDDNDITELQVSSHVKDNGQFIGGCSDFENLISKILNLTRENIKEMYAEYITSPNRYTIFYKYFLKIAIEIKKALST